jgi:DUF4097 and DUF4098 domain-containing protein YvlB
VTVGAVLIAQQPPEQITVPLSDPARPGTLEVELVTGSITVRGSNRKDVLITARPRSDGSARNAGNAPAGLRRLTQTGGFTVREDNNEISVEPTSMNRAVDFEIQVPTRTNLNLETVNGGEIVVEAVEGDLEVENVNGSITLSDIAGSVVANTVNGKVTARLTRLTAQKAMAFTALNGDVDVTLPASAKANLKLRSDNGEVFTDFDIQLRPTPSATTTPRSNGQFRLEVNNAIFGAVNGGGPEFELRTFNGQVYVRKGP